MFEKLANGIPLHEAAAFFIKLRNFEKTAEEMAPPDETGTLEGQFAAPLPQVLAQMAHHIQNELKTQFAYMVYANSLRDLSHNGIAEQFEEHAHDETEHADFLLRRMSVLGGPVNLADIPAPAATTDPHDIVQKMIRLEQEGIESWRALLALVGDENPMKFKIEEYLTSEQEHLDELWQLLPSEANPAILMQHQGTTPVSTEVPQVPPSAPDTSPTPPDHKTAAANNLKARKGLGRVAELLTGSRAKNLEVAVARNKSRMGRLEGAAGQAEQALKESPKDPDAVREYALFARGTKRYVRRHAAKLENKASEERRAVSAARTTAKKVGVGAGVVAGGTAAVGSTALAVSSGDKKAHNKTAADLTAASHAQAAEKSEVYKNVEKKFPGLIAKSSAQVEKAKAKEKTSAGMDLPSAGIGQPPPMPPAPAALGGSSAGQNPVKLGSVVLQKFAANMRKAAAEFTDQAELGQSRAMANLASGFTSEDHTRGERVGDLIGRLAGAGGGGFAGSSVTKGQSAPVRLAGMLGGAALGQHLGGRTGKLVGNEMDSAAFHKNQELKHASVNQLFKLALESMSPAGGTPALAGGGAEEAPEEEAGMPQQPPQMDPAFMQYMQQEAEGSAAEKQQEEAFYKQKFEAANQQLQAATQQMQQLQQQADQTGEMQQQTMAQAQQVQQAAMQNAQAAHTAATQAMQQSMQAQKESIEQAQLAVGMRDSVHAMRHSLLQMVQQELPPATPAESQAIQADQQAAAMGQQPGAPGAVPGQDNTQQPGPDGAPQDPNQAGQPGASPDAGTPPASATPGDGSGAGTSPSAGAGADPTMAGAQPQGQATQAQEPPPKTASSHDGLVGAIMGGVAGAGISAIENKMSNDPLRAKVQKLTEKDQAGGGFINALNLAQAKARLAYGEFNENHPGANIAIGTGLGALTGRSLAPHVRTILGG